MMLRYKIQRLKWKFNAFVGAVGCNLIRWAGRDSNYLRHIESEWEFTFPQRCGMQDRIRDSVLNVAAVFALEGHSGSSAPYTVGLIEKALSFEPFGPLTGAEAEWDEPYDGEGTRQNKRCSHVFQDASGAAYDIEGRIFSEPGGVCFTNSESRVPVTFPYTPKREYVDVPA